MSIRARLAEDFPGHEGRPGIRGGSSPRSGSAGGLGSRAKAGEGVRAVTLMQPGKKKGKFLVGFKGKSQKSADRFARKYLGMYGKEGASVRSYGKTTPTDTFFGNKTAMMNKGWTKTGGKLVKHYAWQKESIRG